MTCKKNSNEGLEFSRMTVKNGGYQIEWKIGARAWSQIPNQFNLPRSYNQICNNSDTRMSMSGKTNLEILVHLMNLAGSVVS